MCIAPNINKLVKEGRVVPCANNKQVSDFETGQYEGIIWNVILNVALIKEGRVVTQLQCTK
jgi:hypothetical protein